MLSIDRQLLQAEIHLKGKPIKGEGGGGVCRLPTKRNGKVKRLLFQVAGAVGGVKKKSLAPSVAENTNWTRSRRRAQRISWP